MNPLVLILTPSSITAYGYDEKEHIGRHLNLDGEASLDPGFNPERVLDFLLRHCTKAPEEIHLIVSVEDQSETLRSYVPELIGKIYEKGISHVFVFPLDVFIRCIPHNGSPSDPKWCCERLLPLLVNFHFLLKPAVFGEEKEEIVSKYKNELAGVIRENTELRARIHELEKRIEDYLRKTPKEHFTTLILKFLPMFFKNFWERFRPDEVALILGQEKPFEVTSPFPEPGPETLEILRRDFLDLQPSERELVRNVVRRFTRYLPIRPQMEVLMEE